MAHLAPKTRVNLLFFFRLMKMIVKYSHILGFVFHFQVIRDGQWKELDASILVPGDIISIKLGDIIPSDARLLEGDPLKIDQVIF